MPSFVLTKIYFLKNEEKSDEMRKGEEKKKKNGRRSEKRRHEQRKYKGNPTQNKNREHRMTFDLVDKEK